MPLSDELSNRVNTYTNSLIERVSGRDGRLSSSSSRTALINHSITKKLQNELFQLMTTPTEGISAFPESDTDFTKWIGTIAGVKDTPYEGLSYKISIQFPLNYPYEPPTIKFNKLSMFHPNVDNKGIICLDILKENWSPVYNIRTILLSLQSLLGEPNNESPMDSTAARLWGTDGKSEIYKSHVLKRHKFELRDNPTC